MTEPYAYEVRYEDADELVYASWLEKYATDVYRAAPRVPLYKESPASVLTADQISAVTKAVGLLWGMGHHSDAVALRELLPRPDQS